MIIKPLAAVTIVLTSLLLSSASLAVAAPVNELYPAVEQAQTAPAKTRTEVVSELRQAQAAGVAPVSEISDYASISPAGYNGHAVGKTRAEVIAELRQSQHNGSNVLTNEVSEYAAVQVATTPRSRADVRAEAVQAAHNGYAVPAAIRLN